MKFLVSTALLSLALLLTGCSSDTEDTVVPPRPAVKGLCDTASGQCVLIDECIDDSECSDATQVCRNNQCIALRWCPVRCFVKPVTQLQDSVSGEGPVAVQMMHMHI